MWMVSIKVGDGGFGSGLTYSACNYKENPSPGPFAKTAQEAIAAALKTHRTGKGTKRNNDADRLDMLRRIESGERFFIECTTHFSKGKAKGAAAAKGHKRDRVA